MNHIEIYLKHLHENYISGSVTDETSCYPDLRNLFDELGKLLKPKVRCLIQLKSLGAGLPDGGLFTVDQFKKSNDEKPQEGQLPARGAIEIKAPNINLNDIVGDAQIAKYLDRYGVVLATNYWDFRLLIRNPTGEVQTLESFRLAETAEEFWRKATQSKKTADEIGAEFSEYLKRVMLHNAPLAEPKDVAWFLASYARDAKARLEKAEMSALDGVRSVLEESLGLKFEKEKGEHFFRSTLVQTLFYGVFSAWVLWSKEKKRTPPIPPLIGEGKGGVQFDWRLAQHYLRVPILRKLFHELADPGQLENLKLSEVLDWTSTALNRVNRDIFFAKFEEEHAVQYFYEPFLEQFDPELRKDLGVWFTPREIVQYMVARVDTVLRTELKVADGLADKNVYVLDPCCGTGAYLVEVLRHIGETLKHKGSEALMAEELKQAAMHRVFGFEILPAPFVVSHMQIGLLLQTLGAPLVEKGQERVGVYLTNALTGWEPPKGPKKQFPIWHEMQEEHAAADAIKQEKPILVILGNPPYNAFAGVSPSEEEGLVAPYKEGLISEWGIKKFNLDDLYVRFFRLAERRIAEKTGKGVVSFISNHSWISDSSYVQLRRHLLGSFDKIWIENMHGNRKISEYAPNGQTSETVFAMQGFSPGIRQGVAISLWVKRGEKHKECKILFREDLNAARADDRRKQLLESLLEKKFDTKYEEATPNKINKFSYRPGDVGNAYLGWPLITELASDEPITGFKENRSFSLIDSDRNILANRMKTYFNQETNWEELKKIGHGLSKDAARFDAKKARKKVLQAEEYNQSRIIRYLLRPFELKWCYYCAVRPLWNEPRPSLYEHQFSGNSFLVTRPAGVANPEGVPFYHHSALGDFDFIRGHSYHFPVRLAPNKEEPTKDIFDHRKGRVDISANLSEKARTYFTKLNIENPDANIEKASLVWMHSLAIGYAPAYLSENADGIRQDWPRIPLPKSAEVLQYSATLGKRIAELLDTENDVHGVTGGAITPEMKIIAEPHAGEGKQFQSQHGHFDLTADWGHGGKDGVTMPGKGKIVRRDYTKEELAAIEKGAKARSLSLKQALVHLGESTCDIYLNDTAYWRNVPEKVWEYTIGGYQVIKKWLSYREKDLLGRALTGEEVKEVMNMARKIAGIIWLEPGLNANYKKVKSATYKW
jgi:Type ISP C-terminal specificity domain/N-6 DNA Methylase